MSFLLDGAQINVKLFRAAARPLSKQKRASRSRWPRDTASVGGADGEETSNPLDGDAPSFDLAAPFFLLVSQKRTHAASEGG